MSRRADQPRPSKVRVATRPDPKGGLCWIALSAAQWHAMEEMALHGWPESSWDLRAMDKLIYYGLVSVIGDRTVELTDLGVRAMDRRFGGVDNKTTWRKKWRQPDGARAVSTDPSDQGKTDAHALAHGRSKDKRTRGG